MDDAYAEQDPVRVAAELVANASQLSDALHQVGADDWDRRATRRGTEPFTVGGLGRFALHEGVHHLHDAHAMVMEWPNRG